MTKTPFKVGWNERVARNERGSPSPQFRLDSGGKVHMAWTLPVGWPGHEWSDAERREYIRGWREADDAIARLTLPYSDTPTGSEGT